ncbi:MAG: family 10 glycosylhydrolase [Kutzneria sp.]|nr:family 10 glycosylhydrolase [Kutzneria sp.]
MRGHDGSGRGPAARGLVAIAALVASVLVLSATDSTALPGSARHELRGMWIASVANIDWPSRQGLPAAQQRQEYVSLLDRAKLLNINAVFVQIRPTADAFYPSKLEPWSRYLTGRQGGDPGYDPLAFLVSEAHKRDLEFHAWFNPYRVSLHDDPSELVPTHPARLHPDWLISYGGQLYYDPGVPAARVFVERVILDTTRRYDIDGVHFDDYFYPYPVAGEQFPDERTYQTYGASRFPDKGDWRRDNVNQLISDLSQRIHQVKPWVAFGVSPFGVWRDRRTDPTGSDTTAGVHDYDDLYADTRTWIRHRWVDYIAPQLYWPIGFTVADYAKLLPWWVNEVAGSGVALYIGQAASRIGSSSPAGWDNPREMPNHIALDRSTPGIGGDIFFNATALLDNRLGFADRLRTDLYQWPALVPARATLPGHPPPRPAPIGAQEPTAQGPTLRWIGFPTTASYGVYRDDRLIATIRADGPLASFTDRAADQGRHTYAVTASDREHHESPPSGIEGSR